MVRVSFVSIKERFESHPVVWGLTLIVGGFISGYSVSQALNGKSVGVNDHAGQVQCAVEGIESLSNAHNERVMALQKEILRLEAKASDDSLISVYQDKYAAAADRLRADVTAERITLDSSLKNLALKCKNV